MNMDNYTLTPYLNTMESVHFIFCDLNAKLCKQWDECIKTIIPEDKQSLFTVFNGPLDKYEGKFDCIVSPANSAIRLDGSFDNVISKMFSPSHRGAVTEHCQKYVYGINNGYLAPGMCLLVPMHHFDEEKFGCKYIALCPTMRIPDDCTWNKEVVYNCMWNLLAELWRHARRKNGKDEITSVLITGLGTGVGGFSVESCARQMTVAWKHFHDNLQKEENRTSWADMYSRDREISKCIPDRKKSIMSLQQAWDDVIAEAESEVF